jgi:tetratricopeptide (TPR) repeat protein
MLQEERKPEAEELVLKYEQYLQEGRPCYFDVDEFETISDFYLGKGRNKESSDVVEQGLRLHPNSSILLLKKATLFLEIGDADRALRILDRLPETDDTEARLIRSECLLQLNRNEEALILLQRLMDEETFESPELALDISSILVQAGDTESATRFIESALNDNPTHIDLLFEQAYNFEQLNRTHDAIAIYKRILDIDPYSSETWFNLGQACFNEKNYQEAIDAYDYALVINPNDQLALLQKAHAFFQNEQFNEAVEAYTDYGNQTEMTSTVCVYIGESYEKNGRFEEAIKCYQEAYEKDPVNLDALTGMGICLMEKEKFRESLIWFERALRIDQQISETWVYVAEVFVNIEMPEEALLCYLRSLEIDPTQADIHAAIGNLHFDAEKYDSALECYRQAAVLNPDLPGLDLFFALLYAKIGETKLSEKYLKEAILKEPTSQIIFDEIINDLPQPNTEETSS